MAKLKSVYFCSSCGNESPKWMGKCPACGEWGSFVEELIRKDSAAAKQEDTRSFSSGKNTPQSLKDIRADEEPRIDMQDNELNRHWFFKPSLNYKPSNHSMFRARKVHDN